MLSFIQGQHSNKQYKEQIIYGLSGL